MKKSHASRATDWRWSVPASAKSLLKFPSGRALRQLLVQPGTGSGRPMASSLDRYRPNEYLVSPCPQAGRTAAENPSLDEVRSAVARASEGLQLLRNQNPQDDRTNGLITSIESDIARALVLLDNAAGKPW